MKPICALVVLLASGFVPGAAAQTSPSAAAPAKIAVIAFQMAVSQTNEFQRDYADLQKKYDPKRAQLKTLGDEIDTLEKQFQAQGDKLSDTEAASRSRALDTKKKQAQRLAEEAQTDFQQEMQDLFSKVASKVGEVLTGYAQQQGYTLVMDVTQQQQQAQYVLYANPSVDITKPVIDASNLKSGVPAPPSASRSAAH